MSHIGDLRLRLFDTYSFDSQSSQEEESSDEEESGEDDASEGTKSKTALGKRKASGKSQKPPRKGPEKKARSKFASLMTVMYPANPPFQEAQESKWSTSTRWRAFPSQKRSCGIGSTLLSYSIATPHLRSTSHLTNTYTRLDSQHISSFVQSVVLIIHYPRQQPSLVVNIGTVKLRWGRGGIGIYILLDSMRGVIYDML